MERAYAYVSKMPPSVQGSGGSDAAFNVALTLVKGFSLSEEEALPIMADWNQGCSPPWSESELRHKLRSAANSSQRPQGYLLKDTGHFVSATPARRHESDSERKAKQRSSWPSLTTPTSADIEAIASLRKLPVHAVDLCAKSGFIGMAHVTDHLCFIIGEDRFKQARRLDGQPLTLHEGKTVKAKNLAGSEGAFIGQRWLGQSPPILLVEGVIGLLEATAAILLADRADWTCLAATSAGARFARDPALLARLRGRRVRIIPDADKTGMEGAASWLQSLESAGAIVDAFTLPDGCKDLGSLVASPDENKELLNSLFQ